MATDADDIFASLGGSLMRDILGTNSTTTSDDILSSLEAELDATIPPTSAPTSTLTSARPDATLTLPPGLPPGLPTPPSFPPSQQQPPTNSSSAAALVVSHQNERGVELNANTSNPRYLGKPLSTTNSTPSSLTNSTNKPANSWGGSIFAFDQNAVADFLREDAARKKEKQRNEDEKLRMAMDQVLFDEDDYDINEQPTLRPNLTSNINNSRANINLTSGHGPPGLSKSPLDKSSIQPQESNASAVTTSVPVQILTQKAPPPPGWNVSNNMLPPKPNAVQINANANSTVALLPPFLQSKVSTSQSSQLPPTNPQIQQQSSKNNMFPPLQIPQPPNLQMHSMRLPPQPVLPPQMHALPGPPRPHGVSHHLPPQPSPHNLSSHPPFFNNNTMQPPHPSFLPHGPLSPLPHQPPPQPQPPQPIPSHQPSSQSTPSRFFFYNPNPEASPVQATKVASSLMTGRDLSYVVHSMLRPLNVIITDPEEDFYFSALHVKRNMIMNSMGNSGGAAACGSPLNAMIPSLSYHNSVNGGATGSTGLKTRMPHMTVTTTTTNGKSHKNSRNGDADKKQEDTSLKTTPLKGREAEALFREKVETRAREWKGEKQVLGHVVKSNIHRPRALLDIPMNNNTSTHKNDGETKSNIDVEEESEEVSATARAMLWKARKLMDVGYSHWLNKRFQDLSRLILEKKDEDDNKDTLSENQQLQMKTAVPPPESKYISYPYYNLGMLMTLSKGRDLVSRCMEYKRAPLGHVNNFVSTANLNDVNASNDIILTTLQVLEILAHILTNLFVHPVDAKKGEDRLLYVCISYVTSITGGFKDEKNYDMNLKVGRLFISCLMAVVDLSNSNNNSNNLKEMLGSRARAEVMHALLTKGAEICNSCILAQEWKDAEETFLSLLSSQSN